MVGKPKLNIAVVGATGAVGQTFLELFAERHFPIGDLHLISSPRSVGQSLEFQGEKYRVKDLENFDFTGIDIAFLSAGSSLSQLAGERIAAQGALVIDNSKAFRMEQDVPLVVPQVNGEALSHRPARGIIANPNCTTIPIVRALHPVDACYGLQKLIISTYQASSGGGIVGMEQLKEGTQEVLDHPERTPAAGRFAAPLPFNVVPSIDVFLETGFSLEEQKMVQESQKILGRPDLSVSATAVRVPVLNCHSEAVYFECEEALERAHLVELISQAEEVKVYGESDPTEYPMPRYLSEQNQVHVGRIRVDPYNPRAAWVWIVSNNLRIGAALNAIQIAEKLMENGVI